MPSAEVMGLLAQGNTVRRVITSTAMSRALSAAGMDAANVALERAGSANSPDSFIRSAATHLEGAISTQVAQMSAQRYKGYTRPHKYEWEMHRLWELTYLLATCYAALNEHAQVSSCMDHAWRESVKLDVDNDGDDSGGFWVLFTGYIFNPLTWFDEAVGEEAPFPDPEGVCGALGVAWRRPS